MGVSDDGGRLLIVSNRLPLQVVRGADGAPVVEATAGGLATGLRGPHESGNGLWFGWPGSLHGLGARQREAVRQQLAALRFVPIELSRDEVDRYYNEFSNGVLWPTFHYLLDRVPTAAPDWQSYRAVNERFADAVARAWRPGDTIWVHDFHLMLVPELLRQRLPEARIGFFLHIPFPASEVFRVLPWRAELLRGLLGASVIGCHTLGYVRHLAASLLRVLGLEVEIDRVDAGGREVRLMALPMGIDVASFAAHAADPEVQAEAEALRRSAAGSRIVLGIDRLDYTKGIPRRLLAFERLLESRPPDAPPVRLVQVAVTSRVDVGAYQSFKRGVDELVGRINGRFGTPSYVPIRYLNRSLDSRAVTALYLAADVMLVTPLRDGLNLVAKEFVAARQDGDGVLVLSEFAGVAAELPDALPIHPYDIDGTAQVLAEALAMPEPERRRRMAAMRAAVARFTVHDWVRTFLAELAVVQTASPPRRTTAAELGAAVTAQWRQHGRLVVCLDYDGTLVDLVDRPEQATPPAALLALLRRLAGTAGIDLHLVSGRSHRDLERWFGDVGASLHAEHGLRSRATGASWQPDDEREPEWRPRVQALLGRVAAHVPGSHVETKTASVAWHYRGVEPAFAATVAKELRLHLLELLSNVGVAVVPGNRVLEVRPQGVHKGNVVQRALAAAGGPAALLVIGDDRTDEDMFAAAPAEATTVHVGPGGSAARFALPGPQAVRELLLALLG